MFGDTLGMFSDGFGRVLRKSSEGVEKIMIFKNVREYFSRVGGKKLSIFSLLPDQNIKNEISIF